MINGMSKGFCFYDKVAKKFGSYHTPSQKTREHSNGDPEDIFREKLLELAGKEKLAFDIGCADGRFTLLIAPYFKKVVAIDLSQEMLRAARKFQLEQKIKNVSFQKDDASNTKLKNDSFDIIYCRRGPTFYNEYYRLLKPNGYFIEITVAEKDCTEIKKIFGRGQGFGNWDKPRIKLHKSQLEKSGFKITFSEEFLYNEYYPSYKDLNLFLQGVPIFEDFDSKKDKKNLEKYASRFSMQKGILLERHRIIIEAQKN